MTIADQKWSQIAEIDPRAAPDDGPKPGRLVAQAVGLTLLVVILATLVGWWAAVPVAVISIGIIAFGHRFAALASLTRLVDRLGAALAAAIGAVLLSALWLLVVGVPWLFQRVLHWDPTWTPHRKGSRWVDLVDSPITPDRMWSADRRRVRSTPGRRVHRVLAAFLTIAVLWVVVGGLLWIDQLNTEHDRYSMAALADEPWWPKISDAVDQTYGQSPISSFVGGVIMRDAKFPGFNTTDARRHTWRPPGSDCKPVVVWAFGGSTMFGLGQRDDHTIPSELARLAWKDGIPLEVHNWGVPADMFWMEARRLELALTEGNPPPDLVVFYDGANDFRVQANMNSHGRGGKLYFPNDLDATALADIQKDNQRLAFLMRLTRDAPALTPDPDVFLPPEDLGKRAADAYGEAAKLVEPVLAERGIPWVQFYQPTRATRSEPLESERSTEGADDSYWKQIETVFRSRLDDHVIDISDAMDSTRKPVYYDELHTNELGAKVVAQSIYDHLDEQLADASTKANGTRACR